MQQKLLIIGQSARMLTYAAQRIGLNPIPKLGFYSASKLGIMVDILHIIQIIQHI